MTTTRPRNGEDQQLRTQMRAHEAMTIAEARAYLQAAITRVEMLEVDMRRVLRRIQAAFAGAILALLSLILVNLIELARALF